jgi:hypothetical protein
MASPIISIQVPSNRPEKILLFLDQLEKTAADHQSFEVIVNLDDDDTTMDKILDAEKIKRPFVLKYIKTFTGGFYNSWKPINDMLAFTDPRAYFVTFLSDEFLFVTPGWDNILKSYIGYYPDNIFRLRASQYRYRNYVDFWECGFAPDSITFYTKKWVDINKDWAPCFSSDSFQQFVAFYLAQYDSFSKEQDNRDIPIPHIQFSGEGASIGLEGEKAEARVRGGLTAWLNLISYPMQLDAARRAMLLKAHIIAKRHHINFKIVDNKKEKNIQLIDRSKNIIHANFSYKLSRIKINAIKLSRKFYHLYYTGGGNESKKITNFNLLRFNITYYLSTRYRSLKNLHHRCNEIEYAIKQYFSRFKETS